MTEDIFVELLWKEVQQVQLFGKLSNQRRFAFLGILENEITSANLHNKLIGYKENPIEFQSLPGLKPILRGVNI